MRRFLPLLLVGVVIGLAVGVPVGRRTAPQAPDPILRPSAEFTVHHQGGPVLTYKTHFVCRENQRLYFTELPEGPVTTVSFDGDRLIVSGTPVTSR